MNKYSIVCLTSVLALALAGCHASVSTGDSNNSTAAAPAAPAATNSAATNDSAPDTADADAPTGQDFNIINKTGHIVKELNVETSDKDDWGPNILGSDVLRDGETGKVTIKHEADDCKWDIRATYDDGDTTEMKEVDLCKVSTVTLTP